MDRYFVVILARDAAALRALQKFELDAFPQTAKQADRDKDYPFSIDGLLSMADIEKVVKAGYRVHVEDAAENRARGAGNTMDFSKWLQGMEAVLRQERAAAAKTRGKGGSRK